MAPSTARRARALPPRRGRHAGLPDKLRARRAPGRGTQFVRLRATLPHFAVGKPERGAPERWLVLMCDPSKVT